MSSTASCSRASARPGYNRLDETLTARLRALGLEGKSVIQLCCNNGREILSVKNLGAARCVGVDQSAPFLEQAAELAAAGRNRLHLSPQQRL